MSVLLVSALHAQISPTPEADALFAKQDWAAAAQAYQKATGSNAADGRSWFRLGGSMAHLHRLEESRAAFQHAIDNQFQPPYAMALIARAWAVEKDVPHATEWLERAATAGFALLPVLDTDPDFAPFKSDEWFRNVRSRVELNAKPCLANPAHRQLDFWVGEWDVEVAGQKVAVSSIQNIDDGCIIQENWMPFAGSEGKSWNFYNPATSKWEQLWISGGTVTKFEGEYRDGAMRYSSSNPQPSGPPVRTKMTFTPQNAAGPEGRRVHQLWEQSRDDGKTWTILFDGIYKPRLQ